MAIRLIECHRVLKNSGSIYLHCDQTMSHYLKILLDSIFGERNFRNELVWFYKNASRGKKNFANSHDVILYYSKSKNFIFNRDDILIPFESGMTEWRYTKGGQKGKEMPKGKTPDNVIVMPSLNTMAKERANYPTQKPLDLLKEIIRASSNKGDTVLDPFCGCATTCVAAEILDRHWIGVDVSVEAYNQVKKRLKKEIANPSDLFDWNKKIAFSTDPPKRTDSRADTRIHKYVYIISNPIFPKGYYKVGIASDIKQRLNSYQTSDPHRAYNLEYNILTPDFRELEKHIHNIFSNNHEWVMADLRDIINEMKKYKLNE